jgi:hypothetical protein
VMGTTLLLLRLPLQRLLRRASCCDTTGFDGNLLRWLLDMCY